MHNHVIIKNNKRVRLYGNSVMVNGQTYYFDTFGQAEDMFRKVLRYR